MTSIYTTGHLIHPYTSMREHIDKVKDGKRSVNIREGAGSAFVNCPRDMAFRMAYAKISRGKQNKW